MTLHRLATTLLVAAGVALPAAAQDDLPSNLVRDLHGTFGEHHARAVHAKGIVLTGRFTPSPEAATLTTATLFKASIPVLVRFSDFTGLPAIPDNVGDANPRGMAIKFGAIDNSALDIVAHSFNGFPTPTAAEFGVLLRAIAASGPGAAKPTALDRYLGSHPAAKTFLTTQKTPASYATAIYFGVNAFTFTNRAGHKTSVRYRFVPAAGEQFLDDAALQAKTADYLQKDIAARAKAGPVRFDWLAQVAVAGDTATDPSRPWPETRRLVKLGTITLDRVAADQPGLDKALLFLPSTVPAGIAPADPMIDVRSAAYPVSFGERQ